ncbi:MAG: hypothetical protein JSV27_09465 [Candidatus Bathyarchaeota archaeon]|nr:MAG: hypothetical protein JSV27_09465 [Candidatus Bathyarchaeota archaeon]
MLFDAVRRFVALSEQVGVKGSDPVVKEFMVTLRRSGFSSSQISELSGGKWSSTLVRQYTKGWGGVDENLDNQRKSLMTTLNELASSGKDITDIENVLIIDKSVRARGSSLEELAELVSNLRNLDLQRGEIGKLVTSSRELTEQHLTPSMVQVWITLDQELAEAGFNKKARMLMSKVCEKYDGVVETLKAVNEFHDLDEIRRKCWRLEEEVNRFNSEVESLSSIKEELDTVISQNRDMINAVNTARFQGFNFVNLSMISALGKALGGPYKVVEAIQKYSSIREIDEELEAKKVELEEVKKETSDKTLNINALNYTLEEAKEAYKKSNNVRQVVELLDNPRGIKMDKSEVVRLLTMVLYSSIQRIEENPEILPMPNPAWDAIYESMKALADRLRSFNEGT